MTKFKNLLRLAAAGAVLLAGSGMAAQAQSTTLYYMANGTRTADYQAALNSWRNDPQFAVDYSKRFLGLEYAYVLGLTGKGLTIGVNDAGVYMAHPLFQSAGKITGLHTVVPDDYGNDGKINPRRPWEGHGTHVSGTIAGDRIAGGVMFGNAYGANLYAATTNFSAGDFLWFKDIYIDGDTVATSNQNIVDLANTGVVRIINNSWGSANSIAYNAPRATVLAAFARNYGDFYKPVLDNDVLVVFSAGNGGGAHAGIDAAAPMSDPRLRSNWLSVANYATTTTPSPSTSFCGQTATWCVTGPGHNVVSGVPGYILDSRGLQTLYPRALYPTLYSATTVAALQTAGVNQFLTILNNYLTAKRAAAAAGTPFDEDGWRQEVARQAVAITLVAGSRTGSPDGVTSNLANLLVTTNNMALLTPAYSSAVLEYANAELARVLNQYIQYTGADYEAYTGTSMAAPNISGFAALLMEMFPEYNTALISDILVSSSLDIDAPGVDLRTGWGVPQMQTALAGPTALRDVREVTVAVGTVDTWSNNIGDARSRYSPDVLAAYPNDIGGVIKKGGGELILTGINDYTGPTRVEGGLLTVNGRLVNSAATVTGVGILGGVGRLASLTAEQGGIVAPGDAANPFGVLTVAGDAAFKTGSFLWVRSSLNGAAYSRLAVGGRAVLEGGQVILKADQGNWNLRSRLNIVQATGGVTGAFAGTQSDLAFLTPRLTYGANNVYLTVSRNDVTMASLASNPNQRALGAALDVMTDPNVVPAAGRNLSLENALLDGSVEAVKAAYNTLTGEVHASLSGVAVAETRFLRDAMLQRGRGAASAASYGRGVSAWASGVFGAGEFEAHEYLADFRNESSGYAAGVEKALSDKAHIGVALGESRSEIRAGSLDSTGTATSEQIGLYGGARFGAVSVRVGGSWASSNIRTNRSARLNALNEQLNGAYDGDLWQAYGEVAWALDVGAGTIVEPYGSLTRIEYNAKVVERGGDAALSGDVSQTATLGAAGFRTRTTLVPGEDGPRLTALAHVAYSHDFNDEGPVFNAAFADGPAFLIRGAAPGSDVVTTSLGVNVQATRSTSLEFGYSGVHQSDYAERRLFGRLSVRF